jgi:hypothetical protein
VGHAFFLGSTTFIAGKHGKGNQSETSQVTVRVESRPHHAATRFESNRGDIAGNNTPRCCVLDFEAFVAFVECRIGTTGRQQVREKPVASF